MNNNRVNLATAFAAALLMVATIDAAVAQTFIGPTPFLSRNDSPFAASINSGNTYLETFESGALTSRRKS